MEFTDATDRLLEAGVSLQEIAEALGVSYATVRATRLDPSSDSYRRPPDGWRGPLASLARDRKDTLGELAAALEADDGV